MERLSRSSFSAVVLQRLLTACFMRIAWHLLRVADLVTKRYGVWGWSMLSLIIALTSALILLSGVNYRNKREAAILQVRIAEQHRLEEMSSPASASGDAARHAADRMRLAAFENQLLPHDDIPAVLEDLLRRAKEAGLSVQRGEYQMQADVPGEFLRYRMHLPVQGDAATIQRFMLAALQAYPALALENMQFKRDRAGTGNVDARIQWVLLIRLPQLSPAARDGAVGRAP